MMKLWLDQTSSSLIAASAVMCIASVASALWWHHHHHHHRHHHSIGGSNRRRRKPSSGGEGDDDDDDDDDDFHGESIALSAMPPLSIMEFRREALRLASPLAKIYYDYFDGEGLTYQSCRRFVRSVRLVPRILRGDLTEIDVSLTIFDTKLDLPVVIAPTAFHDLACPEAEVATARGAGMAGAAYSFNWMLSSRLYEDVLREDGTKWLHLYMFQEKDLVANSIRLAESTGKFSAIILTCDHPHQRVQNRMVPNFMKLMEPSKERHDRPMFPNQAVAGGAGVTVGGLLAGSDVVAKTGTNSFTLSWDDVKWVLSLTKLPVVVKGILSPRDAEGALDVGASAIVVSNHGGRQVDGAVPAMEILPSIVSAIGGRIPIFVDSGIRSSTDVVKALCLGASGVLLGRPALWALSCGGSDALHRMLDQLKRDLMDDLRSLGAPSIRDLDMSFVYPPDRVRIENDRSLILMK